MEQTRKIALGAKLMWILCGCMLLSHALPATAQFVYVSDVWRGGTGLWSTAAKWTDGVPNNGTPGATVYNVFIDSGKAVQSSVTLNSAVAINNLSIDSGDKLSIGNGNTLTLTGNSILNAGKLSLSSTNQNTELIVAAPNVTLSGIGTLTLSDNEGNYIYGASANNTLTNQSIIQGAGQLGIGELTLVNSGTIKANQTNALVIDTSGTSFTNTGVVEATSTGGLVLRSTTVANTGGTLWGNGGTVFLEGATINGGTLKGNIEVPGGQAATLGSPVDNSAGTITVDNQGTLTLENGNYAKLGNVQLNSSNQSTELIIDGANVTFGSGTVTLSNNLGNRIYGSSGSNTLTNQATIQGAGQLGSGQLTLVNSGTINANQPNALLINTAGTSFTNTGLMEATGTGGLIVQSTTVSNSGGTLWGNGGTVFLEGATINGGTLKGNIEVPGGQAATLGSPVDNSAGTITVDNQGTLTLENGNYAKLGNVQLNSSNQSTELIIDGANVTFGSGTVTLSNNLGNRIYGSSGSNTLTNQATIQGAGQLGSGQLTLVNSGTINANQPNALLINTAGTSFTNTGLMEATGTGGLIVQSTTVSNSGGTLWGNGGTVFLEGATINGGTLKGNIEVPGGQAATLGSPVDNSAGTITVDNQGTLTLENGNYTQLGNLQLNSSNQTTELIIDGTNVTFGSGTVTLSNNLGNRIYGSSGSNTLTNQATIQGAGQLGSGQLTLVNSGTINANQPNALLINTAGTSFTNTGLMEATGTGGLIVQSTTVSNSGGTLWGNGGTVFLEGATINGGTLKGNIEVPGGQAATLGSPVDNSAGTITVDNQGTLTLENGNYAKLGNVQLNSSNQSTELIIDGANVTLHGGTVTLSNNSANIIVGNDVDDTLINRAVIQGAGRIGAGELTLLNGGIINANQSAGITIDAVPSFTNNGTLVVSAGDLMHVMGGTFTNYKNATLKGGIYNVAGTLQIDQLGSSGGEIVNNAATIALNGTASSVVDSAGLDALTKLGTNSTTGSFSLAAGRNFMTAAKFSNAGSLTIGAGSTFTVGGAGIFTQTVGTTTDNGTLTASGGVHLSAGSLFGIGTVNGNLQSSGVITPGKTSATTGILTDSGTYTQSTTGNLDIEIGGTTAGTKYDELNATSAHLGGSLNINLINGFVPALGTTFKIVNFNSGSGAFSTVNGLAINGTKHFAITYQPTDVLLQVVSGASTASPPSAFELPSINLTRVARDSLAYASNNQSGEFKSVSRSVRLNLRADTRSREVADSGSASRPTIAAAFARMPSGRLLAPNLPAGDWARSPQTVAGTRFAGSMSSMRAPPVSFGPGSAKPAGSPPSHMVGGHAKSLPKMSSGSLMISTTGLFTRPHVYYSVN